jgi:CubicO group peptidase (beta-lactamase class C family)
VKTFFILFVAICFPSPLLSQRQVPASHLDTRAFTQRLHRLSDKLGLPGFSVAVVQDGKIVYRHSEGVSDLKTQTPIAPDSLFGIASVTKSMTGAMLMQMESEERIKLRDTLLSYPLNTGWHPPASIGDPNITVGDVLSMSAGGRPGETFVYNGARFNLLSGLFDKISGMDSPQSYVVQIHRRVLDPLGMADTIAGFPKQTTPQSRKAVTRYLAAPAIGGWRYNEIPYDWDAAYPASGLISTIDDMAKYAAALDRGGLVSTVQYDRMTTPVHDHPYGYGWFTQSYEGVKIDWAFGYGQADSALFLRVPSRRLTFIFFANADTPSAFAQLDYANVMRQPFGLAFLDAFCDENHGAPIDFDLPIDALRKSMGARPTQAVVEALLDEALIEAFRRKMIGTTDGRPVELAGLLLDIAPSRFSSPDVYMLRLLSDVQSPKLAAAARHLLATFDLHADKRPVAAFWSGNVWAAMGNKMVAMSDYRLLCERSGFDDEDMKAQACERLSEYELTRGDSELGREHLWHSALISRNANMSSEFDRKLRLLAGSPNGKR